ncbi:MAG: DUF2273 domain-containing protein [Spirochaetes bacterium]|nr:DUF2273 domain-containing protein [Spirochaetota bacterium]
MDFFSQIKELINNNPGKALGSFFGLVIGIMLFTLGIIKTLLIVLLVFVGFIIGKSRDENISIIEAFVRFFSNRRGE